MPAFNVSDFSKFNQFQLQSASFNAHPRLGSADLYIQLCPLKQAQNQLSPHVLCIQTVSCEQAELPFACQEQSMLFLEVM